MREAKGTFRLLGRKGVSDFYGLYRIFYSSLVLGISDSKITSYILLEVSNGESKRKKIIINNNFKKKQIIILKLQLSYHPYIHVEK